MQIKNLFYFLPNQFADSAVFKCIRSEDLLSLYSFATQHGIIAIVWDKLQQAMAEGETDPKPEPETKQQLSKAQRIQWALAAEQIEKKYARQKAVIAKLANFFAEHNIKMMILKGYGLSLNYPMPNHRPCSDVDIWLYEEVENPDGSRSRRSAQRKTDKLLQKHFHVDINEDKHHHTVFYLDGVMVENHYDFVNVHSHLSNRTIEARLQQLTQQPMESVDVDGAQVYLPSPDFHALFILRHAAAHFASERIVIRHLLDWRYFVERYTIHIDWQSLYEIAERMNMHRFLNCLNAICIDRLGMPQTSVPAFTRDQNLEDRVWNEILHPEFSDQRPKNAGYLKSWSFMFRRWWANRWKHRIVYKESLLVTFIVQLWSHLLKPKSLKL